MSATCFWSFENQFASLTSTGDKFFSAYFHLARPVAVERYESTAQLHHAGLSFLFKKRSPLGSGRGRRLLFGRFQVMEFKRRDRNLYSVGQRKIFDEMT